MYNAVSLFSGCGGSSLGYKRAGISVEYANEFVKEASDCYRLNFVTAFVDTRDIRDVKSMDILDAIGRDRQDLDLLDGSPPCASFSSCGKKQAGWTKAKKYSTAKKKQRVDDLFYEYIRLLNELQPKVFVAENVSGLVRGVAKGYFIDIIGKLKHCGYEVEARLLDAIYFDVAQYRPRLFFIGVRDDLVSRNNVHPSFPAPHSHIPTLREALEGVDASVEAEAFKLPDSVKALYAKTARGYADEKNFNFRRDSWNKPSYTVLASGGNPWIKSVMHPDECRKFSIAELKRICGFPDDFKLTGTYAQQYERLGRAVPPPMMQAIAENIKVKILEKCE